MNSRAGGSYMLRGDKPVRVAHSGGGQQINVPDEPPKDTQEPAAKQGKPRNEKKETAHADAQADAAGSA